MTTSTPQAKPAIDLSRRDLALDLVRVGCVLTVVAIHLLMVGVTVSADGGIGISRTLEQQPWFDRATWFGQIMPLFFIVGGFASITGWRSTLRRGGDAIDFVRSRTFRLALPSIPIFAFLALALGGALLAGLPAELVTAVAVGVGSPLWFLAAYLLCQAAVPLLARAHDRAPFASCAWLLAGAIAVDVARFTTGITELGLLGLLFVWPLIQQLGFLYADGWVAKIPSWLLAVIAVLAYISLVPLTTIGPYSASMLGNLNPPTVPLIVLGIAQLALLRLFHPLLTKIMRWRPMQGLVFVIGARLMTVYLWHLPMIISIAGVMLLVGAPFPEPASAVWWWSRPLLYLLTFAVLFALSFAVGRFEHPRVLQLEERTRPSAAVLATALVLAFAVPFLEIQWGLSAQLAAAGAVLFTIAVALLRPTRRGAPSRQE